MLRLLLLLLWASPLWARPDIFLSRDWEPEFRVLRSSLLAEQEDGRAPLERQVFTCLLSVSDLQLRRCDAAGGPAPGGPADGIALSDSAGATGCYRAEYEISLEIFAGEGRRRHSRASRYQHESLTLESSRPDRLEPRRWHHFQVDLKPGLYTWWVEFQDLQSRRHVRREGRFRVLDLEHEDEAVSALWLLAEADSLNPDPLASRPFVEERGGSHPTDLVVYYEVWNRAAATRRLESLIVDRRDHERHRRGLDRAWPAGVTRNLLRVPLGDLGSGDYLLELKLGDGAGESRRRRRELERPGWRPPGGREDEKDSAHQRWSRFTVRWSGEPGNPSDLDRAVEQLRYILPVKRFRELQDSPMSRKKFLFDEFWSSVDPDTSTESNELMAEYYRRAEFADRRFSWSRFAGWRSDRGRIYMINGDPDQVERFDGDMDQPAWERWSYEGSGRDYLFVDRQGFGDYQLVIDQGR